MLFELWIDDAELPHDEDDDQCVDSKRAIDDIQGALVGRYPSVDVGSDEGDD